MILKLVGTRPILLHADTACDPLHPAAIAISRATKRRDKKTEEAQGEIARLEWEAGIYHDEEGPFVPIWNVIRTIQEGAKLSKEGKKIERAVTAIEERAHFLKTPKSLDALWADPQYRDRRAVRVGQARIIRTRARMPTGWRIDVELAYVESMIDEETIREHAATAGTLIGLGDFRQRFGRFSVMP